MTFEPGLFASSIIIGVGASLLMDLWNLFLKRAFGIPSLNYCMLGRWISHMPAGKLRHSNIGTEASRPLECALGWTAHYAIGITFATVLLLMVSRTWLDKPTLLPPLLFGIATVVFPFFVLQPSIGLGFAASKTPNPMNARIKSLATHTVFGLGMYLSALVVR